MRPVIQFTSIETPGDGVDASSDPRVSHDAFNLSESLNASSTPPITKTSYKTWTIGVGGTTDIDLTALPGLEGVIQDCTGLKLQTLIVESNTAVTVTIGAGPSNGYDLFGSGNSQDLGGLYHGAHRWKDSRDDVSATDRIIRITGTVGDTINIGLCLG
jgi:hypothetical protein